MANEIDEHFTRGFRRGSSVKATTAARADVHPSDGNRVISGQAGRDGGTLIRFERRTGHRRIPRVDVESPGPKHHGRRGRLAPNPRRSTRAEQARRLEGKVVFLRRSESIAATEATGETNNTLPFEVRASSVKGTSCGFRSVHVESKVTCGVVPPSNECDT